jgi:hypothetical protein
MTNKRRLAHVDYINPTNDIPQITLEWGISLMITIALRLVGIT